MNKYASNVPDDEIRSSPSKLVEWVLMQSDSSNPIYREGAYYPTRLGPSLPSSGQCPECGEENPIIQPQSICTCPLYIYIQPGHHIHVHCPVHGDMKIYGTGPML